MRIALAIAIPVLLVRLGILLLGYYWGEFRSKRWNDRHLKDALPVLLTGGETPPHDVPSSHEIRGWYFRHYGKSLPRFLLRSTLVRFWLNRAPKGVLYRQPLERVFAPPLRSTPQPWRTPFDVEADGGIFELGYRHSLSYLSRPMTPQELRQWSYGHWDDRGHLILLHRWGFRSNSPRPVRSPPWPGASIQVRPRWFIVIRDPQYSLQSAPESWNLIISQHATEEEAVNSAADFVRDTGISACVATRVLFE